jgi:hexokinase
MNIHDLCEEFISEMEKGNNGEESSLRMIPTYIEADNAFEKNKTVLTIDAGCTNFRAALMSFDKEGRLKIGDTLIKRMPGLDDEISKDVFFQTILNYIKPLAEKAQGIGFCFSYHTEIFPDKDGRLIQFCKEIKAHEVVGQFIGKIYLNH